MTSSPCSWNTCKDCCDPPRSVDDVRAIAESECGTAKAIAVSVQCRNEWTECRWGKGHRRLLCHCFHDETIRSCLLFFSFCNFNLFDDDESGRVVRGRRRVPFHCRCQRFALGPLLLAVAWPRTSSPFIDFFSPFYNEKNIFCLISFYHSPTSSVDSLSIAVDEVPSISTLPFFPLWFRSCWFRSCRVQQAIGALIMYSLLKKAIDMASMSSVSFLDCHINVGEFYLKFSVIRLISRPSFFLRFHFISFFFVSFSFCRGGVRK